MKIQTDGDWVKFSDHVKIITIKDEEIKWLKEEIEQLQIAGDRLCRDVQNISVATPEKMWERINEALTTVDKTNSLIRGHINFHNKKLEE